MSDAARPAAHTELSELRRELTLRDLILFSLAGLIGIRWLGSAAHTGPGAVTLWLLAAVFFLVPSAFSMARLSARFPEEGGLYVWTRECFGEWHGFLCFWIYWLGLAFWFPGALMAVTSMCAYAFGPATAHLAENRWFVVAAALILLWIAIGANILGLRVGKWIDNIGGAATYLLAALLITVAALLWMKRGSATPLDFAPKWNWERLNYWSQICYAVTGLELAPVLGGEIRNPKRNLPLASILSAPLVTVFYAASTIALLIILPPNEISPLTGVSQAASTAGAALRQTWLAPTMATLIFFAALGQVSVLGAVAARLPFVVGAHSYLPHQLARIHPRWHTPHIALVVFGTICSVFLLLAQAGESARAAYQIIADLTVIAGFLPFLYIFLSAWKCGARWSAGCGLAVSIMALLFAATPTADVRSPLLFEAKLAGVTALIILTGRWVFVKHRNTAV